MPTFDECMAMGMDEDEYRLSTDRRYGHLSYDNIFGGEGWPAHPDAVIEEDNDELLVKLDDDVELDIKTLPKERFCNLFGLTEKQVDGKIYPRNKGDKAKWTEGIEYIRDPDNKINIILEGYENWVLKNSPLVSKSAANEPTFGSDGKVKGFTKPSEKRNRQQSPGPRKYVLK